ncbi:MAG: hypothetical protein UR61_C0055G0004 [candidate division WS6 bacterium GW2011_GWE1_34_7]|uniref:Uncharacterized protein n=2 Tax=Candidatus Dojkabacteria TaxID=74243 RepID=A0A0G0E9J7_9BACT|nr:MAG: hypothetical protein UR61_C0055G0004 [candidate division WS6 bacterium GW2011_GWE1_34_7]KKP78210.1 MAG: hypothetical protein UR73_C0002G0005 [candidate division WS6 bacterium GW2011_GWF1_35_23]
MKYLLLGILLVGMIFGTYLILTSQNENALPEEIRYVETFEPLQGSLEEAALLITPGLPQPQQLFFPTDTPKEGSYSCYEDNSISWCGNIESSSCSSNCYGTSQCKDEITCTSWCFHRYYTCVDSNSNVVSKEYLGSGCEPGRFYYCGSSCDPK